MSEFSTGDDPLSNHGNFDDMPDSHKGFHGDSPDDAYVATDFIPGPDEGPFDYVNTPPEFAETPPADWASMAGHPDIDVAHTEPAVSTNTKKDIFSSAVGIARGGYHSLPITSSFEPYEPITAEEFIHELISPDGSERIGVHYFPNTTLNVHGQRVSCRILIQSVNADPTLHISTVYEFKQAPDGLDVEKYIHTQLPVDNSYTSGDSIEVLRDKVRATQEHILSEIKTARSAIQTARAHGMATVSENEAQDLIRKLVAATPKPPLSPGQ
jgi:hypothetical protein